MGKLDGKVAIVVGGGRGLGKCVAMVFSREGADVVIAARTQSEIDSVAKEIRDRGRKALAVKTDATVNVQVKNMVDKVIEEFGRIDILVNCQGEALMKPTLQTSLEEWDRIQNSNLKSVFQTCCAVLPKMIEQKSGHIINVSSMAGVMSPAPPGVGAYVAAKAGLIGLTKALAAEVKTNNIKVNILAPAPMDTPMRWSSTPNFDRKKVVSPEIVAEVTLLMVSMPDAVLQGAVIPISLYL